MDSTSSDSPRALSDRGATPVPPHRPSHAAPIDAPAGARSPVEKATTLSMAELLLIGLDRPSSGLGKSPEYDGQSWIGRLVGDYRIEQELGRGGMGAVFRATNIRVGSTVALKLLRFAPGESAERMRRFEIEARSAAALNHPNIINVFDVGQMGDLCYLAMEYVEGRPLSEKIASGPMDPEQAVRITLDVCHALEFAHSAGVIHRDIKPSNVLIEANGRAQLMDFGLARSVSDDALKLTEAGSILGTAHYMSPEQALGQSHVADSRSDIYSVGAMLYEMVTGRIPFDGQTLLEIVKKVAQEEPLRPRSVRSAVDRDLEIIVLKAMDKDPLRRYRSAAALADDLWRYHEGEPIHARRPNPLYRGWRFLARNRAWTIPVGLALVAAVAVAASFAAHERQLTARFQAEAEKGQSEFQATLRQQLLARQLEELGDPVLERWRLIHALRLSGRTGEALRELESWGASAEASAEVERQLWMAILKVELNAEDAAAALATAREGAQRAGRKELAAAAQLYAKDSSYREPEGLSGASRSCLDYHRGHAAVLAGDAAAARSCFERVVGSARESLEGQCAAVQLRALKERP